MTTDVCSSQIKFFDLIIITVTLLPPLSILLYFCFAVKRRLCDSKVVGEHAKWVELSVKPAIRAWSKGRNLGLAVVVEDQEGTILKADRYFKGASCTVGACECV